MPAGILPNEGIAEQLECILKRSISGVMPWTLIFWVNDYTPTVNTVLSNLVEATWDGYVRLTLDRAEWTTPTVSNGCAHSTWTTNATQWYVNGGPVQTIYGYAYVDYTSNKIRVVQRFDAEDIRPIAIGGKVTLLPEYTLTSAACPEEE